MDAQERHMAIYADGKQEEPQPVHEEGIWAAYHRERYERDQQAMSEREQDSRPYEWTPSIND